MGMRHVLVLLLHCVAMYGLCKAGGTVTPPLLRLMNDVLDESRYNPAIVPSLNHKQTKVVNISFTLIKVQGLDEVSQTLTSHGLLEVRWYDDLLQWDPSQYDNITRMVLPPDQVWLPELMVLNSVQQLEEIAMSETMKFRVMVTHDGRVVWRPAQRWETYCHIVMTLFPFDTQTCEIMIGNHMDMKGANVQLNLETQEVNLPNGREYTTGGAWRLDTLEASIKQQFKSDSRLVMTIKMERLSEFYVYNIILPIVIITQVSMLVYILPPASGEKISFTITILLTYFVLLLMVSEQMPKAGEEVPYITSYICLCMFLNSFSLLFTVIVLNFYHHHPHTRVPKCLRVFFFECCGRLLCCSVRIKTYRKRKNRKNVPESKNNNIFMIKLENENKDNETAGNESTDFTSEEAATDAESMRSGGPDPEVIDADVHKVPDDPNGELDKNELEMNQEEWMNLATVVDHLLFVSSFIIISSITIIYFIVVKVLALTHDEIFSSITGWVKDV